MCEDGCRAFCILEGEVGRAELLGEVHQDEVRPDNCVTEALYALTSPAGDLQAVIPWLRTALGLLMIHDHVPPDEEQKQMEEIIKVWSYFYLSTMRLSSLTSLAEAGMYVITWAV